MSPSIPRPIRLVASALLCRKRRPPDQGAARGEVGNVTTAEGLSINGFEGEIPPKSLAFTPKTMGLWDI